MRALEPGIERLESRIEQEESELQAFRDEPEAQIEERLSELSEAIKQTDPRPAKHGGNRSMYDHLVKLREGIKRDPDAWVNWRKSGIREKIDGLRLNEIGRQFRQEVDTSAVYGIQATHLNDDSYGIDYEVSDSELIYYVLYKKHTNRVFAEKAWSSEDHSVGADGWTNIADAICINEDVSRLEFVPRSDEFAEYMLTGGFEKGDGVIYYAR